MDWGAYPHPRHPRCKAGVHSWLNVFLDSLLSQRMTEWGAYPAPSSPSPSSPLLRKRRKAGVHSWLNVFLDSLLSQRMTEWGAYPAPSSPSPTHLRHPRCKAGGPFLADCLSGFPAFAENDEMGAYPHLRQPRPLTFVTLAAKRRSMLD